MAWFGDNFRDNIKNFTGQLSDYAKDVLTEGTEEVSDHPTELKMAHRKIWDLEAQIVAHKTEVDRLKSLNTELEEKAESSELQINSISSQYRSMIQQKEDEIKELKQQQHAMQDFHDNMMKAAPLSTSTSTSMLTPSNISTDDQDFGDVISSQFEINRLSHELRRVQAECDRLKQQAHIVVDQQTTFQMGGEDIDVGNSESSELRKQIKDLEKRLVNEIDEHQHELSTLQDVHSQKLSLHNRRHKQDIEDYQMRIEELESQIYSGDEANEPPESPRRCFEELRKLRNEKNELENKLQQVERRVSQLDKVNQKLKKDVESAQKAKKGKEDEVQDLKRENHELLQDGENLKQNQQKLMKEFENLLEEHKMLTSQLEETNHMVQEQAVELEQSRNTNVMSLQEELEKAQADLREANEENEQVRIELHSTKQRLLLQLDDNHAHACEMIQEFEEARKVFASGAKQQSAKLFHEKQELVNQMIEIREQMSGTKMAVASLEAVHEQVKDQTEDIVTNIGSSEHQELTGEIMNSLESENNLLKEQVNKLESLVKELECSNSSLKDDKLSCEGMISKLKSQLDKSGVALSDSDRTLECSGDSETESMARAVNVETSSTKTDDLLAEANRLPQGDYHNDTVSDQNYQADRSDFSSESDRTRQSGGYTDNSTVTSFDGEFDDSAIFAELKVKHPEAADVLKSQLEHFEMVKADFDMEKQALEDVLMNMRSQLKEKERTIQNLTAQKALLEMDRQKPSDSGNLQEQIQMLENTVIQCEKEKEELILEKDDIAGHYKEALEKLKENEKMYLDNKSLKEELNEIEEKQLQTTAEIASTHEKLAMMNAMHVHEMEEISEKLRGVIKERNSVMQDLDAVKNKLNDKEQEVKEQNNSKAELTEKLQSIQDDLERSKQMENEKLQQTAAPDTSDLIQQVRTLENELSSARVEIQTHDDIKKKMTTEFLELKNAIEDNLITINEKDELLNELNDQLEAMETRMVRMASEQETTSGEKEDIVDQFSQQVKDMEQSISEMQDQVVRVTKENDFLTAELKLSETRLREQEKEYEETIKDLQTSQEKNVQSEYKTVVKRNEEQKSELAELKARCEDLELDARHAKDALNSASENQQQLTEMLKDKDQDIKTLAEENAYYQKCCVEDNKEKLQEMEELLKKLNDTEAVLTQYKEKCDTLSEEIQTLKEEKESENADTRTLEVMTDLESEINQLKNQIDGKEKEITAKNDEILSLNDRLSEQGTCIEELNEKNWQQSLNLQENQETLTHQENKIAVFQQKAIETGNEIHHLKEEIENLNITLDSKSESTMSVVQDTELVQDRYVNDSFGLDQKEKYTQLIKDKDEEMLNLKEQNKSLTKLLEDNSPSEQGSLSSVDMDKLELRMKTVEAERNQMMSVLNEKTRECSNLKNEVHRLMKAVSEGSAALNKLQEDNVKLSHKLAGPNNDMHKEALQKLSRIIQDKDLEIESMRQKTDSLMAVLQQMNPGDSPNVDSLLHSNAELQKQNTILQSEKDQLIVSLTQKHQESIGYYEEVQRLLGFLAAEQTQYKQLQGKFDQAIADQAEVHIHNQMNGDVIDGEGMDEQGHEWEEKHNKLQQEYTKLRDDLHAIETKHAKIQEEYNQLLETIQEKENTVQDMMKKHQTMQEDVQRLKKSRDELLSKADSVEMEKSAKEHLQQLVQERETTISHLQEENERLIGQVDMNLKVEREALQGSAETAMVNDRVMESKEAEIKSLRKQNEFQAKSLHDKDEGIKKYTAENASLKQTISQCNRNLKEKDNALRNTLEDLNDKKKTLQNKLEEMKDKDNVIKTKSDEISSLKHQVDLQNKQIQEKDSIIKDRTGEIASLKQQAETYQKHGHASDELVKNNQQEILTLKQNVERQNKLIQDRDIALQSKVDEMNRTVEQIRVKERENNTLKQQNESWLLKVRGMESEIRALKQKEQQYEHSVQQRGLEAQKLQETLNRLSSIIQEKDFEIDALRERSETLTRLVQEKDQGNQGEVERMMKESTAMQQQALMFQHERDQAILAYNQRYTEFESLQQEVTTLREKEQRRGKELDRLRQHLLEVEEGYTKEALLAEDREKELRNKLAVAEEKAYNNAVHSASQQVNKQVESLQEELHAIASQRDQAVLQVAAAQEQTQQYAASLANLQSVLEQFQQESQAMYATEMERYQRDAQTSKQRVDQYQQQNADLQARLNAATEALDSASRLTEQLDKKDDTIRRLKNEVSKREEEMQTIHTKLERYENNGDSKVDKPLVKNLLVGYFSTPKGKQTEVLRLISRVLNFDHDEMEKVGLISSGGWLRGWLTLSPTPPSSPVRTKPLDSSFTESFVSFLKFESTPNAVVKMPVEEMTKEKIQSTRPSFNPFTAPPLSPHTPMIGAKPGGDSTSHILMKPVVATLPTFTPMPIVDSGDKSGSASNSGQSTPVSGSNALKEILKQ
ncbi:thyroid receptor-interacting protein 11-like [Glandiceps talaboti]